MRSISQEGDWINVSQELVKGEMSQVFESNGFLVVSSQNARGSLVDYAEPYIFRESYKETVLAVVPEYVYMR